MGPEATDHFGCEAGCEAGCAVGAAGRADVDGSDGAAATRAAAGGATDVDGEGAVSTMGIWLSPHLSQSAAENVAACAEVGMRPASSRSRCTLPEVPKRPKKVER